MGSFGKKRKTAQTLALQHFLILWCFNFQPSSDGYIGIVLCRLQDYNNEINKLHSQEKYEEKIKGRLTKENDAQTFAAISNVNHEMQVLHLG